jgi:hypothetical protein
VALCSHEWKWHTVLWLVFSWCQVCPLWSGFTG